MASTIDAEVAGTKAMSEQIDRADSVTCPIVGIAESLEARRNEAGFPPESDGDDSESEEFVISNEQFACVVELKREHDEMLETLAELRCENDELTLCLRAKQERAQMWHSRYTSSVPALTRQISQLHAEIDSAAEELGDAKNKIIQDEHAKLTMQREIRVLSKDASEAVDSKAQAEEEAEDWRRRCAKLQEHVAGLNGQLESLRQSRYAPKESPRSTSDTTTVEIQNAILNAKVKRLERELREQEEFYMTQTTRLERQEMLTISLRQERVVEMQDSDSVKDGSFCLPCAASSHQAPVEPYKQDKGRGRHQMEKSKALLKYHERLQHASVRFVRYLTMVLFLTYAIGALVGLSFVAYECHS